MDKLRELPADFDGYLLLDGDGVLNDGTYSRQARLKFDEEKLLSLLFFRVDHPKAKIALLTGRLNIYTWYPWQKQLATSINAYPPIEVPTIPLTDIDGLERFKTADFGPAAIISNCGKKPIERTVMRTYRGALQSKQPNPVMISPTMFPDAVSGFIKSAKAPVWVIDEGSDMKPSFEAASVDAAHQINYIDIDLSSYHRELALSRIRFGIAAATLMMAGHALISSGRTKD